MELDREIARILLDPERKQILEIAVYEKNLRFKCKRCATFCCKLGGPKLTKKDIERIAQAGYEVEEFFIPFKDMFNCSSIFVGSLKSREDGSCIFLKPSPDEDGYECSIYDFRPALCRLYPFELYKRDFQSIVLGLIPCCRGLNNPEGEAVDESFIASSLLDAILDVVP